MLCAGRTGDVQYEGDEECRRRESVRPEPADAVSVVPVRSPHDRERIVFLGSGPLKGLAEESALKVLELTGGTLMAVAESSLGFRHGPKAVLNERSVAVVYVSNDPYTRRYDHDIVAELRGNLPVGSVVAVSAESGAGTEGADAWPLQIGRAHV